METYSKIKRCINDNMYSVKFIYCPNTNYTLVHYKINNYENVGVIQGTIQKAKTIFMDSILSFEY
jgi:hypothetical protein